MKNFKYLVSFFIFQFFICFLNAKDLNLNYYKDKNFNIKIEKVFRDEINDFLYTFSEKKVFFYENYCLKNVINVKNLGREKLRKFFVFDDFIIFIFKNNSVVSFDRRNGNILWKKLFKQKIFFKPVVDGDVLFIDQGAHDIISINVKTGNVIWTFHNMMRKLLIYTNGKVLQTNKKIVYIYSNKVLILNKESGKKISSINIQSSLFLRKKSRIKRISDAEIYNDILFICYDDGSFLVLDINNEEILWKKNKDNYKSVSLYKKFLFVSKKNGNLTILNKFNGKKIFTTNKFRKKTITKLCFINKSVVLLGDNKGFLYFFEINSDLVLKKIKVFDNKIKKIILNGRSIIVVSTNGLTRLIR